VITSATTFRILDARDDEVSAQAKMHGIALRVPELRRIVERLGRDPTIVEAHAFDAQWSEHCSYKSSRIHLSRLPGASPDVLLGPGEDAGIVRLGDYAGEAYGIVMAHESHNHPSQVVPFEGAATGVGGIVRDVLCMGAEVIAVADPLRFGPRDDAHSRYVAQGVVDGIAAYGNAIGVPNIGGDTAFHPGFRDNCLVNVIALGLVKERDIIHSRAPEGSAGWDIVLVGKATDRSGFGGAAFSSLALDEDDAQANKGAVQVPDPFLKSVLMRASYRAFEAIRERGLTVGYKDLGAGGIMGCTAEIVAAGGFGATIDLDACPTAIPGLAPAVIAVGETQERMTWVVPPSFTPELLRIYNEEFTLPQIARGARAAVIGRVEPERDYVLRYKGEEVMRVPIDVLTAGIRYDRTSAPPRAADPPPMQADPRLAEAERDWAATLKVVLAHPDVCSRAPIYERYDGVVRGVTALPPGAADAGVLAPIPGSTLGCALGVGGNPRLGRIDARLAAEHAVYEAVRAVVAVGARPAGLSDCLNFGNPEVPEQMGELVAAIDGLAEAARAFDLAFVTGNVSLYNESASGASIPCSPIVGCVGVMHDVSVTATRALKAAGSPLYFVGSISTAYGGSVVAGFTAGGIRSIPRIEYERVKREHAFLLAAFEANLVLAAHDVSDGGLITALAEMAIDTLATTPIGLRVARVDGWFSENGGFAVEAADGSAFEQLAAQFDVSPLRLGETAAEPFFTVVDGERETPVALADLHVAWSAPLRDFYEDA
jgi:phosphoribosylformylglycinamidine synthase